MNKDIMIKLGFGEQVALVEQGKCPMCKEEVNQEDFESDKSRKEFKISGMCQVCQDEIFV